MIPLKESKNPIFIRLAEQVLLEHNLYKQREGGMDYLATFICDFLHQPSYIENCLKQFLFKSGLSPLSLENLPQYAIPVQLATRYNFTVNLPPIVDIAYHLSELAKTKSYPSSLKSTILFFLKDIYPFELQLKRVEAELLDEARAAKKERKFHALPDILFGCRSQGFFLPNELEEIVRNYSEDWTREKVSKFILFLQTDESPSEYLDKLVRILEMKIDEEFNSWIEPDIWFSIIESEKLVNSNIEEEDLRVLLRNLKEAKVSWSEVIEEIEKEGVFLRLRNFAGKGGFASFEDALSLLSLKRSGREQVYAIDKIAAEEYRKLKNIGPDTLSKSGVSLFVIINMLCISALVAMNIHLDLPNQVKTLINTNISPSTIMEALYLLVQAPLISVLLIVWNINLWKHLRSHGTLTIAMSLSAFPFVKKIQTFFE